MPSRTIFLRSVDDPELQRVRREVEYLRDCCNQILMEDQFNRFENELPKLLRATSAIGPRFPMTDRLRVALSFPLFDDEDIVQPDVSNYPTMARVDGSTSTSEEYCLRRPSRLSNSSSTQRKANRLSNQFLLRYIRHMSENHAAVERELMRARALGSMLLSNRFPDYVRPSCDQTQSVAFSNLQSNSSGERYRRLMKCTLKSQDNCRSGYKRNQLSRVSVPSYRHIKDIKLRRQKLSTKENMPEEDIFPTKDTNNHQNPVDNAASTMCPLHNIALILPSEVSIPCTSHRSLFTNYDKVFNEPSKGHGASPSMETCQKFVKKTFVDKQCRKSTNDELKNRSTSSLPVVGRIKIRNTITRPVEDEVIFHEICKKLINDSNKESDTCTTKDGMPIMRAEAETQTRVPTLRSTVHTAYNPANHSQSSDSTSACDGFMIQLLKLAVLLYAPALMPALNSLIARQNPQTSIPIPCFEGANELLSRVFRLLTDQQSVPNLPSVPILQQANINNVVDRMQGQSQPAENNEQLAKENSEKVDEAGRSGVSLESERYTREQFSEKSQDPSDEANV